MKHEAAVVVLTIAALLVASATAAQEPVTSFDQLNTRLKPGDTVWVTDAQGREIRARIAVLGPMALTLEGAGVKPIDADAVRLVTERKGRPVAKGALLGLAAGAVFGVGVAALGNCADCGSQSGWMAVGAGVFGAMGASAGVIIGALVPGKTLVVYRAPGSAGAAPSARLSIAPVVTPRAKGIAFSLAF